MGDRAESPIPIPERFVEAVEALYRAQHRAETRSTEEDRRQAQALARRILFELGPDDDKEFAGTIQEELAATLVVGCPSTEELEEAAELLERSLSVTAASSPRVSARAALLANVSLLLALVEGENSWIRGAIASAERGGVSVKLPDFGCLVETMMALSFARELDPELITSSVGSERIFGRTTLHTENRAIASCHAEGASKMPPRFYLASARLHLQYAVFDEDIAGFERVQHVTHALQSLGRLSYRSLESLRSSVLWAVVLAASVTSILSIGLAFGSRMAGAIATDEDIRAFLRPLTQPIDFSSGRLIETLRRVMVEYSDLGEAVRSKVHTATPWPKGALDMEPVLVLLEEFCDRSSLQAVTRNMWREIRSQAAAALLVLHKGSWGTS